MDLDDIAPGKEDQAEGRVREAAGDLTGDDQEKAEGSTQNMGGKLKEGLHAVTDKVRDAVDDIKD